MTTVLSRRSCDGSRRAKRVLRLSVLVAVLAASVSTDAFAPPLQLRISQANQSWDVAVGPADILGGDGGDFADEFESASDEKQLDVKNPVANWRIDVSRSSASWHTNIHLYIRRTSDGTGTGTISIGTTYQEITTTNTSFFDGTGQRDNVDLQFKVGGAFAAAGVPAGSYVTTITYTVTDNL